jgi:ribulose-5-phosphate 4-epimerase/fuculose-1-phosphate aldolase
LKQRLVEGLQVITGEGVLSGSGHLSTRVPGTETFLINPRFAGVLAGPKEICTVNFEGKRIAGKGPIPSETPIHAAVYRSRPDIGSVIHCHARYSILVGLLDSGLIPFNREARLFADGVPIFPESRGINSFALAQRMVDVLGLIMRFFSAAMALSWRDPASKGLAYQRFSLNGPARTNS